MCSNVCYNLAQKNWMLSDYVKSMREAYEAWDAASAVVRKAMPKNPR